MAMETCTCPPRPSRGLYRNLDCPQHGDGGVVMAGVREYDERMAVRLVPVAPDPLGVYGPSAAAGPRLAVVALNEAGCNSTSVDLLDLITWLKANRPELLA